MQIDPVVTGLPIVGGLVMLSLFGWKRENSRRFRRARAKEEERRKKVLEGSTPLRPKDDTRRRGNGYGQISIAAYGSYAAGILPATLMEFERAGAEQFVGPILLCELARDIREMCLEDMPPIFRDRVIQVRAPMLPGGLGGETIEEVQLQEKFWLPDVRRGAQAWLEAIDQLRAVTDVNPMLNLSIMSPGGHAALGYPVTKEYHKHFPAVPVYASTILDHKTIVRSKYPDLRALYNPERLIRGYITCDNRLDQPRNDFGMAQLFSAMTAGSWLTRKHLGVLNGLNYVFPGDDPGRTGTISVWAETIPVFYLTPWEKVLPGIFYTRGGVVQEKMIRGIESVLGDVSLQGLPLERAGEGATRVLCVIGPIEPKSYRADIVEVEERIGHALKEQDVDCTLQYASVGQPLTPQSSTAVVSVVLLQAVAAQGEEIDALARGTLPIRGKFLPPSPISPPQDEQLALPGLNGQQ